MAYFAPAGGRCGCATYSCTSRPFGAPAGSLVRPCGWLPRVNVPPLCHTSPHVACSETSRRCGYLTRHPPLRVRCVCVSRILRPCLAVCVSRGVDLSKNITTAGGRPCGRGGNRARTP